MSAKATSEKIAGVSSDAVRKATGKTWPQWLALLDRAGAKKMSHQEIVAHLREKHGVGGWWQQMLTVGYEQARQKRQKGQMPDGFQVSATKTVAASLADLYAAWADESLRARWLGRRPLSVPRATAGKSMRLAWSRGKQESSVSVNFYGKGAGKSQVSLEHSRLAGAAEAEKIKEFWRKALEKMKNVLEEAGA